SRCCSDAVRLMCLKSGARLRRADCLLSARRHLQTYRPSLALVDIGLPDGSGIELIRDLAALGANAPRILATSGDDPSLTRHAARKAGASGFIEKPLRNLRAFQEAVLALFPDRQALIDDRVVPIRTEVTPDPLGISEDLHHLHVLLGPAFEDRDRAILAYCAQFLGSVASVANDPRLSDLAKRLRAIHPDAAGSRRDFQHVQQEIAAVATGATER
ncbi:MAG: response regulator, partial [Paracoccaceae bacterium]